MAEIRRDLVKNNWVGIVADMALKPHQFPINKWGIDTTGNWYLEITPRLLVTAGVDIATGIYMNPVAPELSASLFRDKLLGRD